MTALALLLAIAGPDARHVRARAAVLAPLVARESATLDPRLFSAVAWRESRYDVNAVGARGELGAWQVNPRGWARTYCRRLDIRTTSGGARCAARLLREGLRRCGSVARGLGWYGSGRCDRGRAYAARILSTME